MDSKYGQLFTESDVEKLLDVAGSMEWHHADWASVLAKAKEEGIRFKFPEDEPIFVLRGRDQRAIGAIRYYRDHQSPRAPMNHLDGLDKAVDNFERYRHTNAGDMKEPD